ncbi:MAG: cofactor-independent phosphoglycerate mutase [Candidatus Omnitrophica bacterium]|nr:cofactor-independent phosphoglycerate mutase [Candidatus Omnitrophota bacterium]
MKYIVLVGDGMADIPMEQFNDRTILEIANTPYMDKIVERGRIGLVNTIPQGMSPASDVANLSIMGYDPLVYYSGRGPLEAANMGINITATEVAFRCNTVTIRDDLMEDYSAGHITTKESKLLINKIQKELGNDAVKFYPGISYRHLAIIDVGSQADAKRMCKVKCIPPHDILGKNIMKFLPKGKGGEILIELMNESVKVLQNDPVNKVRVDLGENPANMIWLWGQGTRPDMPLFKEKFGSDGSVISAVDLINGIGKIIGLDVINVPGATGYYDTNYKGKAEYALKALENKDFVFVHVEAPDEAGHNGDLRQKIKAIENFDKLVVGTVYDAMEKNKNFRIMVLPDHPTPVSLRCHTSEPVPFAIAGKDVPKDDACVFSEASALASNFRIEQGCKVIEYLFSLSVKA